MNPRFKKFFNILLVFVLFSTGVILLVHDGGSGQELLSIVAFIATVVVAVKTGFGKLE